jgi:deoxyribodipyrimidine photo-lyase
VFWNRRFEPAARERDERVQRALAAEGCRVETFNGSLLFDPAEVRNKGGRPFQVFTPFLRHCLSLPGPVRPIPEPRSIPGPAAWPDSLPLNELQLLPTVDWAGGLRQTWSPGAASAAQVTHRFFKEALVGYDTGRDFPAQPATSRLSPHLHFGEVSVRQLWWNLKSAGALEPKRASGPSKFLSELCWREFAHHTLYHFPFFCTEPLRTKFKAFPWRTNPDGLCAWKRGLTGFPLVDAGMRQLWQTGWMHNRVRMVAGSFLVKDLLLSWVEGARWFWDTLVDADLAQNSLGWQWVAGCGPDAAPFFRVFNPDAQSLKFDPEGAYIRRWVPELAGLDARWIHRPDAARPEELSRAGVQLGGTYPFPIVRHPIAREVALEAYQKIKAL